MLPSASDRRAWLPVLIMATLIVAVLIYAGFGSVLVAALSDPVEAAVRALALAFTLTVSVNVCIVPLIALAEWGITHLTGMKVEY
jgi:hypothetical protein